MSVIQFDHLSAEERSLLYTTPALVTYLIGGADGNFDTKEEVQSSHFIRIHSADGDPILFDFYKHVETTYFDVLDAVVKQYERTSVKERTDSIIAELEKLNEVLPKVDNLYARVLIKSLRSLAKVVAEASGGVLGFLEVGYEEEQLMGLEMITYQP
ncbi:MAG TPA: hypothetical protein PLL99_04770 [Chitinophagales bacterium]|jgi:hypothetical protein|nr:hypothetical protein [Chitinophagales bacterium]HQG38583.1 hypothetical protein [Chitinophagales bacterium]